MRERVCVRENTGEGDNVEAERKTMTEREATREGKITSETGNTQ